MKDKTWQLKLMYRVPVHTYTYTSTQLINIQSFKSAQLIMENGNV